MRKIYGESKRQSCYFCEKDSTSYNSQKLPVCRLHQTKLLASVKCVCGLELTEILCGKWGPFANCANCGNINVKKLKEFSSFSNYKINGALKK